MPLSVIAPLYLQQSKYKAKKSSIPGGIPDIFSSKGEKLAQPEVFQQHVMHGPEVFGVHHQPELDPVIAVSDGDAILMAQKLANIGLAVGISSGANFLGALTAQNELGKDAIVVTVFADSNKKYLSTDLMHVERVRAGYLSPDVEVLGFEAYNRLCGAVLAHYDGDRYQRIDGRNPPEEISSQIDLALQPVSLGIRFSM